MDVLCRVIDLGKHGRRKRWTASALATALLHAGIISGVLWRRNFAASLAPIEVDEVSIEQEPKPALPADSPPPVVAPAKAGPKAPPNSAPRPVAPSSNDKRAAPETAQASAILARQDDDPFANSFVTGDADRYAGGPTSSLGKFFVAAHGSGIFGGTGLGRALAPKRAQPDRSRPAWLVTNVVWDCGFPSEADPDKITYAAVRVAVTVRADGSAESVEVLDDPGNGFGRVARACALGHRFLPALNREGRAISATTRPFAIGFRR
jgi:periplasmic protein TonB